MCKYQELQQQLTDRTIAYVENMIENLESHKGQLQNGFIPTVRPRLYTDYLEVLAQLELACDLANEVN